MSSETDQSVKIKKKSRIPKRYNHHIKNPPPPMESRQDYVATDGAGKRIDIDYKKLERYMWSNPTLEMTTLFFGISAETIEKTIQERYALTFSEFREKNILYTRNALVQKAIQQALEGNNTALHIFALKNICGWSDSINMNVNTPQSIQLKYSLNEPPKQPEIVDVTPRKEA
jgi:hypothetical protein